uniref:Chondroitin proteoglycan 4 domain-containing protein n=1 Tax=Plectus sambesii TaxID=2011161 RepID=A0A914WRV4_9BILA
MIGLALTAVLLVGVSGSPMLKNLQNLDSPCVTKCVSKVENMTLEVDFGKTTNYGKQLGDMDEMCTSMAEARDCVAKCNVPFNPFDMKTMKSICSEEKRAEMKKHSACYKDQGNATTERCNEMCGSMEESAGDLQGTVITINATKDFDLSSLFDSMGDVCTMAKCHARCNRDVFDELCRQSDPTAGSFMQQFTEDTLTAMNEDLTQFGMRKFMKGMLPKECHYMFSPGLLFNETETTSMESSNEEENGMSNLFSELFKSMSSTEEQQGKESKVDQSELRLLDKKERNLDKQIEKLNLELDLLNKKLSE